MAFSSIRVSEEHVLCYVYIGKHFLYLHGMIVQLCITSSCWSHNHPCQPSSPSPLIYYFVALVYVSRSHHPIVNPSTLWCACVLLKFNYVTSFLGNVLASRCVKDSFRKYTWLIKSNQGRQLNWLIPQHQQHHNNKPIFFWIV